MGPSSLSGRGVSPPVGTARIVSIPFWSGLWGMQYGEP
jgi:hypothetical protein